MHRSNLVYDDVYDDADVLQVPDWGAEQAFYWPMRYSEWLVSKGRTDMETEGFVEWLNAQISPEGKRCVFFVSTSPSANRNPVSIFDTQQHFGGFI